MPLLIIVSALRFVYGGSTNATLDLNHADETGYLNVYALSLPAFRWFKSSDTTSVRRACHTCSVIGKRQMVRSGEDYLALCKLLGRSQILGGVGLGFLT